MEETNPEGVEVDHHTILIPGINKVKRTEEEERRKIFKNKKCSFISALILSYGFGIF